MQVILNNRDLEVVEYTPQKSLRNIGAKSVVVDLLCEDAEKNFYNVEVQKSNDDDHQKRVRYNSSNIDTYIAEKGIKYKNLKGLYIIYISAFDIFGKGKTIYHIDRVLRETGDIVDNGYYEIYVNGKVDDGSDVSELMKIFNGSDIPNNEKFPNICKTISGIKQGNGGEQMCSLVDEYAEKRAKRYAYEEKKILLINMVKKGKLTADEATEELEMSLDEFLKEMEELEDM